MSLTSSPFAVLSFAYVCACVCVWLFVASPHTYRHTAVACSALNALAVAFAVVALYYCYMRLNVHMFGPLEQAQEIEKKEEQMAARLQLWMGDGDCAGCLPHTTHTNPNAASVVEFPVALSLIRE